MPFDIDIGVNLYLTAAVALLFVVVLAAVKTVPQGMHYTVERFGRYTRTLLPGLSVLTPFVERVGARINMREQVLDVPSQEVITRDNATVSANGVTFFQVLDAARAAYEITDLELGIRNLTMTNIRSVMGSMDLDELLSNRDEINSRVLRVVDAAVDPWGVKITRIEILDINPPPDLAAAMGRQMKAEREKRAVVLEAEGERTAAITRAEGQKQAQILAAEGRREAAFRDAEARERTADAEAAATASVSRAIAEGSVQAINYFVAQKYIEALRDVATAPNQRVLILPIEATATLGSLAGIAEIARETFAGPPTPLASGPEHPPAPRSTRHDIPPPRVVPPAPPEPEPAAAPEGATVERARRADRAQRLADAAGELAGRLQGRDPWGRP